MSCVTNGQLLAAGDTNRSVPVDELTWKDVPTLLAITRPPDASWVIRAHCSIQLDASSKKTNIPTP